MDVSDCVKSYLFLIEIIFCIALANGQVPILRVPLGNKNKEQGQGVQWKVSNETTVRCEHYVSVQLYEKFQ
jgi:hypothetical protein